MASGWKIAIPNPSRGHRFSDVAFNAVARLQLGIPERKSGNVMRLVAMDALIFLATTCLLVTERAVSE